MDDLLQSDVLDRLDCAGLKDRIADLILAALLGEIESVLGGNTPSRPVIKPKQAELPLRAYVESITVEGFRGIGPKATISLRPGPGLTLIVGRNGSGKSSFSEALELLLTGENQRWGSKRTRIWKEGWRNLHHPDFSARPKQSLRGDTLAEASLLQCHRPVHQQCDGRSRGIGTRLVRHALG